MNPALVNVFVGLLQTVGPSLVTWAVTSGNISAGTAAGIASIAAALGLSGWSAATTKVAGN